MKRGSLLIVTLWMVTLLSVLAIAMAKYLSLEVRLTKYRLAREQAKALARSGVYLAMQRLAADAQQADERYDWLGDDWAMFAPPEGELDHPAAWIVPLPAAGSRVSERGRVEIQMIDEERKLNLNQIACDPASATYKAFTNFSETVGWVEKLVDYHDMDSTPCGSNGLEEDDAVQPPYKAKDAALVAHEEVLDIPGWPAETLSTMRQWSTVADPTTSSNITLNINTVSPELLVALGFGQATAQALAACREQGMVFKEASNILTTAESCAGPSGLSSAERSLLASQFVVASQTFTVISTGIVAELAVKVQVEAIVQRSPELKILAWRE